LKKMKMAVMRKKMLEETKRKKRKSLKIQSRH
jgi:hypothetical protein